MTNTPGWRAHRVAGGDHAGWSPDTVIGVIHSFLALDRANRLHARRESLRYQSIGNGAKPVDLSKTSTVGYFETSPQHDGVITYSVLSSILVRGEYSNNG